MKTVLIKYERIILMTIILLGLVIRLYGINLPLVDSHQVRQVQTAIMARNLYEDHMNIFRTRLDMFGNMPGYIILEFPLMHGITALLYYLFGVHDIIGRLVSVAFSVGAMFLMYGLARQFLPVAGSLAALVLYAFSPMNIFFSRAFMPESSMMFFTVGAVYFFFKWLDKKTLSLYITAIIFAAFACLTKPTAVLIFAPILTAWFLKYRTGLFKRFDFWFYMLLTVAPFILWSVYTNYFNTKIPYCTLGFGNSWLQSIKERGTIVHWFDPKFYLFLGGSIIALILTPLGFLGTVFGIFCVKEQRQRIILYLYLAAVIFYFYALSSFNFQHYYYHLHLLPAAVIFFGFAVEWLVNRHELIRGLFKRKSVICISIVLFLLVLTGYGVGYSKFFRYMYNNRTPHMMEVSEIIKKNAPKDRFIIDSGNVFLTGMLTYYSHSRSLPYTPGASSVSEIENLRTKGGATTFVVMETAYGNNIPPIKANKDLWLYLNEKCIPVAVNDHYLIFDLRIPAEESREQ